MARNEDIIGRTEVDDLEAILAIANTDVDEAPHRCRQRRRHLHLGLRQGPARPQQALREGQALPVERRDGPAVGHRRGRRAAGRDMGGNPQIQRFREDATRAPGSPFRHFGEAEWTR